MGSRWRAVVLVMILPGEWHRQAVTNAILFMTQAGYTSPQGNRAVIGTRSSPSQPASVPLKSTHARASTSMAGRSE